MGTTFTRRKTNNAINIIMKSPAPLNAKHIPNQNTNHYNEQVGLGNLDPDYEDEAKRGHLHHALLYGGDNECIIENLIKSGCDVNKQDKDGLRPLHLATKQRFSACLRTLISFGAYLDVFEHNGLNPLMMACTMESPDLAEIIIRAGATVNLSNKRNETALHIVASLGLDLSVKLLVDEHAVLSVKDSKGITPLMMACKHSHVSTVGLLMSAGAYLDDKSSDGNTAVHYAVDAKCTGAVSLLIKEGANLDIENDMNDTPMVLAIKRNHSHILYLLIQGGCDTMAIDGLNGTALGLSINLGHIECTKVLLKHGMDPDEFAAAGKTPLMHAVGSGRADIVELLLQYGADSNHRSRCGANTLIGIVSEKDIKCPTLHHRILMLLLRANSDVNQQLHVVGIWVKMFNCSRCTCIYGAILSANIWVAHMLLLAGAELTRDMVVDLEANDNYAGSNKDKMLSFLKNWMEKPSKLTLLCRKSIRSFISTKSKRLRGEIDTLSVPQTLKDYLDFSDLENLFP